MKYISFFPKGIKGEGNYTPLFLAIIILFIVAIILNLTLASFDIDTSVPNPDSTLSTYPFYSSLIDRLSNADFFGSGIVNFILEQINVWTYVPSIIAVPFFILFFMALVWTAVKLFLP